MLLKKYLIFKNTDEIYIRKKYLYSNSSYYQDVCGKLCQFCDIREDDELSVFDCTYKKICISLLHLSKNYCYVPEKKTT